MAEGGRVSRSLIDKILTTSVLTDKSKRCFYVARFFRKFNAICSQARFLKRLVNKTHDSRERESKNSFSRFFLQNLSSAHCLKIINATRISLFYTVKAKYIIQ